MRTPGPDRALVALLLAALAAPCLAQNAAYPPWPPPRQAPADHSSSGPNTSQLGAEPSAQLVTPSREGSSSVTTAAEAPLHEMNLIRQKIPPVLLTAMADPYAYPTPLTCANLARSVNDLTVALGPDFDIEPAPPKTNVTGKNGLGLQIMHGAAGGLLPFHGFVGLLSGASKHDELVIRAISAGSAQRAYLKGLGEARRCRGPATPHHLDHPAPPIYDGPRRPKYPIR